jgi:Icc-related predicted phosphoesterase
VEGKSDLIIAISSKQHDLVKAQHKKKLVTHLAKRSLLLTLQKSHMDVLRFLFITDIHHQIDNINCLRTTIAAAPPFNGIIITGDISNYFNSPNEPSERAENSMAEIAEVLKLAKSMHETVYFLPGNHDPLRLYEMDTFQGCINLHGKSATIDNSTLSLFGIGGSTDAFSTKGKLIWSGYPYTEDIVNQSLCSLFLEHLERLDKKDTLFLTHSGPISSSKTYYLL